jgi:sugar transferase (PEP-CTERM/EpsH1 system associated)
MADYGRNLQIPVRLIDYCDLDSEKFKQFARQSRPPFSWLYQLEGERLTAFEKQAAEYFDHVIFIGPEEKKLFDANGCRHKVALMSNGVDFARYYGNELPASHASHPDRKPYLLFTGAMDYLPNIDAAHWFAREIFPQLKAQIAKLEFYIVGGNPAAKIRKLHDERAGIVVTGYVDDVRPYVKNASVFVAPMRIARGMQTKILEAMACGVPVVTSPSAARGIGARADEHVLVAETVEEFVRQTRRLLSDRQIHAQLRKQAFKFLQENFCWERNLRVLEALLEM